MVIYPRESIQATGEDRDDDKVEEIWITALSNAGYSRIVGMFDSTTRSRGKSTIELLQQVSAEILSMRWHHDSLL